MPSPADHLKEPLDNYVAANWAGRVRIHRLPVRGGGARARNAAVPLTSSPPIPPGGGELKREILAGEILVFLDAHVEVGYGWLPPLLTPILRDRRTVTAPILDFIHEYTWAYRPFYRENGYKRQRLDSIWLSGRAMRKHLEAPFRLEHAVEARREARSEAGAQPAAPRNGTLSVGQLRKGDGADGVGDVEDAGGAGERAGGGRGLVHDAGEARPGAAHLGCGNGAAAEGLALRRLRPRGPLLPRRPRPPRRLPLGLQQPKVP